MVYARKLGDRVLEFGARGAEKGALLLYDRQTNSTWSQIQGRATDGPLAGTGLERLPSVLTTWGRWRSLHPRTTVYLHPVHPYKQWYTASSFARMNAAAPGPPRPEDWVVGVEGSRTTRAWLVRRLSSSRVVNDEVDGTPLVVFLLEDQATLGVRGREVEGRVLSFFLEADRLRDRETGTLWDPLTGTGLSGPLAGRVLSPVPFSTALWYAWAERHPDGEVAP